MSILIDADVLIERIYEYQSKAIDTEDIIHSIKTMPTSYDIEKVVERLEVLHDLVNVNQKLAVSQAIEIVRKGGVE